MSLCFNTSRSTSVSNDSRTRVPTFIALPLISTLAIGCVSSANAQPHHHSSSNNSCSAAVVDSNSVLPTPSISRNNDGSISSLIFYLDTATGSRLQVTLGGNYVSRNLSLGSDLAQIMFANRALALSLQLTQAVTRFNCANLSRVVLDSGLSDATVDSITVFDVSADTSRIDARSILDSSNRFRHDSSATDASLEVSTPDSSRSDATPIRRTSADPIYF